MRQTQLSPGNLILPLFVRPGKNVRQEIGSMPGNFQLSLDRLADEVREVGEARRRRRDPVRHPGAEGRHWAAIRTRDDGIVQQAVRAAKEAAPGLLGDHRRLLLRVHRPRPLRRADRRRPAAMDVDNDATLELLAQAGRQPCPGRAPTWSRPAA